MNNLLLNNTAKHPGAGIYFCKVIRFLPSSNTADIVTVDNNISLLGCNVVCPYPAGFAYGARYFPTHDDQNPEVEYVNSSGDIYCVAAFLESDYNNAAILGFLFPLETTLSIAEYGLYIFRHESDVIWMVRGDGTMQIYHPSGSIIKIGDDNTNEVDSDREQAGLYPAKTDGLYIRPAADYNAQKETNLFIKWHAGQEVTLDNAGNAIVKTKDTAGTVQTTLTMTPDGNIIVTATNDVTVTAGNDVTVNASNDVIVNATRNATVNAGNNISATADKTMFLTATSEDIYIQATLGGVYVHADQIVAIADVMAEVNAPAVTVNSAALNLNVPGTGTMKINGVPADSGTHSHAGGSTIVATNGIITQI